MTKNLRVVLIDDEPLALRRLELLIADLVEVEVVGSAMSCGEAREVVSRTRPDVLLLDIRLRDGSGFDLLNALDGTPLPVVIFVTAFDHFAVQAFECAAIDYLLKPIDPLRLGTALERARQRAAQDSSQARIEELLEVVGNLRDALHRQPDTAAQDDEFWIRSANGSLTRLPLDEVEWISSEDDYVRLHTAASSHLLRSSIKALEDKLDPQLFVRVRRSALVRISSIAGVRRTPQGRREVILANGTRIAAGRVHYRALRDTLRRINFMAGD